MERKEKRERANRKGAKIDEVDMESESSGLARLMGNVSLRARMKISVLMDISVL